MTRHAAYEVSVLFASLVGAAGLVLSLQAWARFRGTPFGRVLAVLPPFMLVIAVYHPIMLVFPAWAGSALLIESVGFALLLAFAGLALQFHRRLNRGGTTDG